MQIRSKTPRNRFGFFPKPFFCVFRTFSPTKASSGKGDSDKKAKKKGKNKDNAQKDEAEAVAEVEIEEGPIKQLDEKLIAHIASYFAHLQMFRSMRVSKRWLEAIKTIKLDVLDLSTFYGHLEDEHLVGLVGKFPQLHTLRVYSSPRVTEKSMKSLGKLQALTTLDLTNCRNLTDNALLKIPAERMQSLTSLKVTHCGFTDRALKLGTLPALTSLNLSHCDALHSKTGAVLVQIAPSLLSLDVSCSPSLTNDFLSHIRKITSLTSLNLRNSTGYDYKGFDLLCTAFAPTNATSDGGDATPTAPKMLKLRHLDVSATFLNNDSLKKVCDAFPTLTSLSVAFCTRLDDAAFASIDNLAELEYFSFAYTCVTPKILKKVCSPPKLKTLVVSGCSALRESIKPLAKKYPELNIVYKTSTRPDPKSVPA